MSKRLNYDATMDRLANPLRLKYPATQEERRAGMAAFRAKLLGVHQRLSQDPRLSDQDRAYQRELVDSIKTAQKKFGEGESK
jgi:hypothetical protein